MLVLPEEHRLLFKDPFGKLYPSLEKILPLIKGRIVFAVGDVVTHNLQKAGVTPALAIVDGHTMRSPCSSMPVAKGTVFHVKNPAGTLSDELIQVLNEALRHSPSTIIVDGEEDLAVIPLVLAAPEGSIILYGQPEKGVVLRFVDPDAKKTAQQFFGFFVSR